MDGITDAAIVMDNSVGSIQQEQVLITIDNLVVDQAMTVIFDLNAGTWQRLAPRLFSLGLSANSTITTIQMEYG
jgi:hypothetical protein